MKARTALVSACLLGLKTRYDGDAAACQAVVDFLRDNQLTPIPVCPEQLAGLPTPRPKCWFRQGDGKAVLAGTGELVNEKGEDVSAAFIKGACETLKIARLTEAEFAILQQRSPSCGFGTIYLQQQQVAGNGVAAEMLQKELTVYSNDALPAEKI